MQNGRSASSKIPPVCAPAQPPALPCTDTRQRCDVRRDEQTRPPCPATKRHPPIERLEKPISRSKSANGSPGHHMHWMLDMHHRGTGQARARLELWSWTDESHSSRREVAALIAESTCPPSICLYLSQALSAQQSLKSISCNSGSHLSCRVAPRAVLLRSRSPDHDESIASAWDAA